MDKSPYYIVLVVLLLFGLVNLLSPRTVFDAMPKFFRKIQCLFWCADSENPSKGLFTLIRIGGGIFFIISLLGLLGLLTGRIDVYK